MTIANPRSSLGARIPGRLILPAVLVAAALAIASPATSTGGDDPSGERATSGLERYLEGSLLLNQGQVEEAIEAFRAAWAVDTTEAAVARELARAFHRQGRPDSVVVWARRAVRADPADAEAWFLEAISLVQVGRTRESEEAFRRARDLDPENPSVVLNLIALLYREGRIQDALDQIWPTLPSGLEIPPVRARRAALLVAVGREREAIGDLAWVLSREPDHPEAGRLLQGMLGRLEELEEVTTGLETIVEARPDEGPWRLFLARSLSAGPRWAEAIPHYERLRERRPDDPILARELGVLLFRRGDAAGAEKALTAAWEAEPRDPEPIRWLWRLEMRRERFDEAYVWVTRLAALAPDDADAAAWQGATLAAMGRDGEALLAAESALARTPAHRTAGLVAAGVLARRGDLGRAVALLGGLARAHPDDRDVRFRWGAALEEAGRVDSSLVVLEGLIEEAPGDHRILNHAAYACIDRGIRLDDAMEWVRRALSAEPTNASYLDTYGWGLVRQGKFREALAPLRAAADALPAETIVLKHLGRALDRAGEKREAAGVYRRALELDPEDADVRGWLDAVAAPPETGPEHPIR